MGGPAPLRHEPRRRRQAQVLPADDVPVSVGEPAHRALVRGHADGCPGPVPPNARRERFPANRLRCLRAARGKRRDKEQDQPAGLDAQEHRQHAAPAALDGRHFRLERRGHHLRPRLLPLEPVDIPAVSRGRIGLPRQIAGRLVPQRRDPGSRAGRRHGPALLALWRRRREA